MTNASRLLKFAIPLQLLAALAAVCGAQTTGRFGLDAGATVPLSGYGSNKDVGYHIGILVDVRVPQAPVGFRIDGAFHELKYSSNSTKEQIWIVSGNATLRVPTGTMLVPYVIGGAGIYNNHHTLFLNERGATDVGVNVGGGLRFELTDLTTFIEARYHTVSGQAGIRLLPITLGILF